MSERRQEEEEKVQREYQSKSGETVKGESWPKMYGDDRSWRRWGMKRK